MGKSFITSLFLVKGLNLFVERIIYYPFKFEYVTFCRKAIFGKGILCGEGGGGGFQKKKNTK